LWFSLYGIILERKPIGSNKKKKSLNESSWYGESKCVLRSRLFFSSFFCSFLFFFFIFVVQILWKWKACYELKTLLRANQLPHFLSILELIWLVL
jgi:hypothetical protein